LKKCPNCKAEQVSDNATSCAYCGYSFDSRAAFSGDTPADDDDLDFVVYEANEEKRDFVGEDHSTGSPPKDDDLGIETTANLMEQEAAHNGDTGGFHSLNDQSANTPIGQSEPPPPPPAYDDHQMASSNPEPEPSAPAGPQPSDSGGIRRLSDEELKTIERNLYGSKSYVSDKEKNVLINKLEDIEPVPFGNAPIVPPKKAAAEAASDTAASHQPIDHQPAPQPIDPHHTADSAPSSDLPSPQMAKRGKGIAYFYKNYIELKGAGELCADDEIVVNNREFILRPKKIKRGYLMGSAIGAFVILLAVAASFFIKDTSGYGEVVGVVLGSNDSPFIQGATIRFPELGMSVQSNEQGFFKADHVPAGSHKIEYIVGNDILKVDYATVASNEISTVSLRPANNQEAETTTSTTPPRTVASKPVQQQPEVARSYQPPSPPPAKENKPSQTARTKTKKSTATSSRSSYGDVTLAANIDGAKFEVDGSVMGAGNLNYKRIKPGVHDYEVSLEGYHPIKGSFSLAAGESKTLKVTLSPMKTAEKKATMKQDDYYYSGVNALKSQDYDGAIKDLTHYINDKPSSADAFFHRAEANNGLLRVQKAHDDYVHAAELYQVKGNFNEAVTAYNRAIEIDGKSITAYLGRAAAYMNKGEELAAIADYDKVIYLDRRNFQAYFGLGEARYREGQYKQAIEQFKNARSVDERNALVYQYLTLSYLAADDYKNVKKSYEKFMEYASKEQKGRFADNSKYETVKKIVDMR
jgi:tetratricopeptide (TPR) repeat protein